MLPSVSETREYSPRQRALETCSRLWPWARKGTLALSDQFLNSGSNFLLAILLARWLPAHAYGAYALAFSIYLLGINLQQSLVTEPMAVFGPATYRENLPQYLGVLLWINGLLAFLFALFLGVCALVAHEFRLSGGLAGSFAGLSLAAGCNFVLQWLRRALYLEYRVAEATAGSLLYSLLLVSGTWIVYRHGLLSSFSAFVVMAIGSLVTSAFLLFRLKPVIRPAGHPDWAEVWRRHWDYGRWVLGTSAVKWIPGNSFYLLTGGLLGMADVGALKALLNLFLPLGQAGNSLSLVFQPYVSGVFGRKGRESTRVPVEWVTIAFLGAGLAYLAVLVVFKKPLFHLLYGGKFMDAFYLVPWVAVGGALVVASYGPAIGLRAIQSPSSVFGIYSGAALVSIVLGVLGTWALGLKGTIGAWVLSDLSTVVLATWMFYRKVGARPATESLKASERSQRAEA